MKNVSKSEATGCDRLRRVRGFGKVILWICLMESGMVAQGGAAEWSLAPSIGVKGIYNSNLLLTPEAHSESYGYWIAPAAEFAGRTERLEVSSRLAADFAAYFGGEERRLTNIYLPLTLRYSTESDVFGFTGGFVRDNTLMGELRATGVVLRFTQRNQWTANPTWTRRLTERLSVQSSLQFSHTTYEGGGSLVGLVNYQVLGGTAGLLYKLTEHDQLHVSGSYTRFQTIEAGFRANFPGVMMTVEHAFTETIVGTVFGGPRFIRTTTETAFGNVAAHDTVWIYGATLSKQFERALVQVNIGRDVHPSGFGLLIKTDRAGISGSYQLSETITGTLDIDGYLVSGAVRGVSGRIIADQQYVSVTPRVSWKFLEWWQVELAYTYGSRDVEGLSEATSQATMVTLTYYPPKLSFSR